MLAISAVTPGTQDVRVSSMATSVLYQSIELLSQEKGIDPGIVVGAVEEAIALATRKFYKTQENMRGELNKDTGEIRPTFIRRWSPTRSRLKIR